MAIMTGVQSAQVLGPSTQKQADKSRQRYTGSRRRHVLRRVRQRRSFDSPAPNSGSQSSGGRTTGYSETDGGQDQREKNNGLDVIRTNK